MANRWGKVETVTDFIFLGPKITADGETAAKKLKDACSLEEKLRQTCMLKSRDITLPTQVLILKAMVFPVVM